MTRRDKRVCANMGIVAALALMIALLGVLIDLWPHVPPAPEKKFCPPYWECNNDPAINNPRCCR